MDVNNVELTAAQREAVTHVNGPLLVLAGPGSGKTRVITHRIAYLIDQGIPAWQIAALTFTNKAADEMRTRVETLAPDQRVWMGTFHRFCAQLLRKYASMVGLAENYSIYDTSDAKQALKLAIQSADVSTSHTSPEQIAASISNAKNRLITAEMMTSSTLHSRDTVAARVYPAYQRQLLSSNAVDFDDLLLHVALLLRENPDLRSQLDARYRYILVDEYQDTNLAQYAIVRALSVEHPNLAVTGDPDQSIYGWRGADLNNILDFEKDYPAVRTVRLEQNYRSTPNILRVADQLIRHNRRRKHKELFTDADESEQVMLRAYGDGYQEADGIVDRIAALISSQDMKPSDFAVFYRMNSFSRTLEHALRHRGIPYQIVNGLAFYQRKEIKDLLAYLHLINNPYHDVALIRVINTPTRGIGAKTVERLRKFADQHRLPMLDAARRAEEVSGLSKRAVTMVSRFVKLYDRLASRATASLEDLIRMTIKETDYEAYLDKTAVDSEANDPKANVDELISAAVEFDRLYPDDGSLELYLEQISLVADTDAFEETSDRVTLMTLHAAKGLEFPHVFIVGVEDEVLPHQRSRESEAQLEEERRLLFVGITRAEQWLQLSYCKRRTFRGREAPVIPSPFLNELPREDLRVIEMNSYSHDWFDETSQADPYPESWDLDPGIEQDPVDKPEAAGDAWPGDSSPDTVFEHNEYKQSANPERSPATGNRRTVAGIQAGLTTAANLMSAGTRSLAAYQTGSRVRHPDYGDGEIVSVTGRGPKRTARVQFEDEQVDFRLAFADLELH